MEVRTPESSLARETQDHVLIKRLLAFQDMETSMNSLEDADLLLPFFLERSLAMTGAVSGAILLPDPDPAFLKVAFSRGFADSALPERVSAADGLAGKAFREGKAGIDKGPGDAPLGDASLGDGSSEFAAKGARIALALSYSGTALGVLVLLADAPGAFEGGIDDLLANAAAHAGQLLRRSRLKAELERKIRLKDILLMISHNVDGLADLKDVFEMVMRQLAERFGIIRGMLVLFGRDGADRLSIHSAYNLTDEEISRGVYRVGEGVIGRAVESGVAEAIPDIRQDGGFLNRTRIKRRKDVPISFIAAPFTLDGHPAGVIAVEKVFESAEVLADEKDLVLLVGTIIADKVRAFQRLMGERERLEAENESLKQELKRQYAAGAIVCKNRKMLEILELVNLVADSATSIMLLGESGTGKEMIARLIHDSSPRREGPFVSVNCAAIPENLLESELFGHKRGSFTGAVQDKKGKFLMADGGTIFLDEIGDMPMHLQVKLLRAVQEREVEPVGAEAREKIDVRFLAATNRDLAKLISEGKFREDLFYRLNVVEIRLPPLRERADDIPFLAAHFIEKYSGVHGRAVDGISPQALRILQTYFWPGNVRELENVMERAILLSRAGLIEPSHLPLSLAQGGEGGADGQFISRWVGSYFKTKPALGAAWDEVIGAVEKELIQQAMLINNRNKLRTADFLGINRNTLRSKIERYGLE
jgi:Nif-specific regulatory protein